ncbi:MAG: hypothetical protein QOI31_3188 [Solirubrobacterales bacterium]|jgi:hypothetical protein|nr:hypothetical protein [Solirubrobacterales bacterium]
MPTLAVAAPPANDSFASPVVLSGTTATHSGNNSEANIALQSGEPNHADWTDGIAARSVWYRWQAPAGVGETSVSLCDSADTADSVVVIYTGTAVNALTMVPGGRNDDGCGNIFGPSEVTFTPVAGTTYRIVVADWDADDGAINGPYELDLFPAPGVPANDAFANAEALTGTTDTVVSNNIRATMEAGEPNHATGFGGSARRSVWFKWQAPAAGDATVSLCDSGETDDSVVAVYTGSAVDALSLPAVASNDDGCEFDEGPSEVSWDATAGTTYRIAVANWDPDSGIGNGYELDFTFVPVVSDPPPDTQITAFLPFTRATTFGPGGFQTSVTQALSITFSSPATDLGHFECLVDDVVVDVTCDSPYTDSDPPAGSHTFAVRAVDAAGSPDPSPATQNFAVDKSAPSVAITGGPANGSTTSDTTPAIAVTAEAGATLVCRIDAGDYEACPGATFDMPELSEAEHAIEVYAIDSAGNVGGPASRTFTVVSGPVQDCIDAQAALADAEADLADADAAVASAETRLQKAKQTGKRKKVRKARAKLKAAKVTQSSAATAVAAAQQAVAENCD